MRGIIRRTNAKARADPSLYDQLHHGIHMRGTTKWGGGLQQYHVVGGPPGFLEPFHGMANDAPTRNCVGRKLYRTREGDLRTRGLGF